MTNASISNKQHEGIAYPPLSEVRKSIRVKWYRSPIEHTQLRTLSVRTDKQGWKQAGGHLFVYLVLVSGVVYFWSQQSWLAFLGALWCLGFVATFFKGTSVHELGHGTVFKTKLFNFLFLHGFSLISWWDPYDYAASHTYHHRYTTHPQADRENVVPLEPSLAPWLLLQLATINLFSKPGRTFNKGGYFWTIYLTARTALGMPYGHTDIPSQEWLKTLHEDQPQAFQQSVWWSRLLIAFHGSVWLIAVFTGWWVLPLVLSMPSYIANIGSYFLGTTQHCGLRINSADFRQNTRSIKINPIVGFLYWHMNWHTEHHMYAGVPCYNLKQLNEALKHDLPEPKSVWGAWKEMREIWHRQKQQPDYEHTVLLPDTGTTTGQQHDDAMASSIGDLAPKGFRID